MGDLCDKSLITQPFFSATTPPAPATGTGNLDDINQEPANSTTNDDPATLFALPITCENSSLAATIVQSALHEHPLSAVATEAGGILESKQGMNHITHLALASNPFLHLKV